MADDRYSVASHLAMVFDEVRTGAYREALRRTVTPGCTVVDIGTGTGILAILSCQLGARRVYAIEPAPVIEVARQIASDNGVADRIEFIPELSTEVTLPVRADVVVSDLNGVLPLYRRSIASLIDARTRFLADRGAMIPARDQLWAAMVESSRPHPVDAAARHGATLAIDMSAATRFAAGTVETNHLSRDQVLTPPASWAALDFATVTTPDIAGSVVTTAARDGIASGIGVWFDTDLTDTVSFSNAPGKPRTIYGNAVFPLEVPIELSAGDWVEVDLEARLTGGDYAWRWRTRVGSGDGRPRISFEQSTLGSVPLSVARLRRREAGYLPTLSREGEIDSFLLSLMDGTKPLSEIAAQLTARFPERFESSAEALSRAARLSEQHSR